MAIKRKAIKKAVTSPGFIILILLLLLGVFFQGYLLNNLEKVKTIISSFGILGPITFILLIVLGIVLAPINGFLIWLPGFYIFGLEKAIIYAIIAGWIGALIAFFIARKLGRPVVIKFVGKKEIARVDKLTDELGIKALWILRLFGGVLFDVVSYASGLTNISFKQFLMITVLGSLPIDLIVYLLIKDTQNIISVVARISIVSYAGAFVGLALLFLLRRKKV